MPTATRPRVLVSGAGSGIGRATARRFAAAGWDVCATSLDEGPLHAAMRELAPGGHLALAGDYARPETGAALTRLIADRWGALDALVSCAGVFRPVDLVAGPPGQWRELFDVMMGGAVNLTRAVLPLLGAGGRVVHVSSIHATRAERGAGAYALAKAALEQYCRALAVELADRAILVNAIAPGFVDTPMAINAQGESELDTPWFRANYVDGHHLPLRRAARPEEIAGVALFLCGPDASYVTGQTIVVDGGLTITF